MPLRHALEVRHPSFADPAFLDLARARNMAVVFADHEAFVRIEEQTADFTYARLQRSVETVETGYDEAALDGWARQVGTWAKGGRDVFVYFTSGAKVRNPAAAQALIARLDAEGGQAARTGTSARCSAAATASCSAPTVNGLRSISWPLRSSPSPSPT